MITLNDFLKMAKHHHYRIYQPNRDCLIFESYFKVHSPFIFSDDPHGYEVNSRYWNDNDYCGDVYCVDNEQSGYDAETANFLRHYGNYEVLSIEISGFKPIKVYTTKDGHNHIEYLEDLPLQYEDGHMDCLNIFIIPQEYKKY